MKPIFYPPRFPLLPQILTSHFGIRSFDDLSLQNLLSTRDKLRIEVENLFHVALEFGTVERSDVELGFLGVSKELWIFHGVHKCFSQRHQPILGCPGWK